MNNFYIFGRSVVMICFMLNSSLAAQENKEPTDLDEKLEELYQRQQFDDAAKILSDHLKVAQGDNKRRIELFRLLDYVGKTEEGIKILQAGITNKEDDKESDKELLWYQAQTWLARGDDGPNVSKSGGTVTYHPSKMTDEEEQAWKEAEYKKAADAFRKVLKNSPDYEPAAEFLVRSLKSGSNAKELKGDVAGEVEAIAKKFPENTKIGLLYCDLLIGKKDLEQAIEKLNGFLEKTPRNAHVFRKLATVYKAKKDDALARESLAKAAVYDWMPPFAKTEFSPELARSIVALQTNEDRAKLIKMIKGFIADKTQASTDLMAAVCWHHLAHGAIENSCFEELERRGEGDLLVSLVENARSICTAREGGMALARMKHPEALRILSHLVVNDQRPVWINNAAGALETLGDERAVKILIETADPKFKEADRQRSEEDAKFMQHGPYHNRLRCILALGAFDTDESKKALALATRNPDLALVSEFALYRLTKDDKHLKKGMKLANKESVFEFMVARYIERAIKDEKSLAALKAWRKEYSDKPEKEE